jgi:hypothetical protein
MSNNEGFVDILVEDMRLDDPELKSYDGKSGARLPPGTYPFEVVTVKRDKSKKGNPMLVIDYKVIEGEHEGVVMKSFVTLDAQQDVSRARLKSIIEALGVPLLDNGAFSTGAMIGCRMEAEVEHETQDGAYDPVRNVTLPGKTFAKIVSERPLPGNTSQQRQTTATAPAGGATRGRPVGSANGARQQSR